jgi:hypothetical protein
MAGAGTRTPNKLLPINAMKLPAFHYLRGMDKKTTITNDNPAIIPMGNADIKLMSKRKTTEIVIISVKSTPKPKKKKIGSRSSFLDNLLFMP